MDDLHDTVVVILHFGSPAITEVTLETLRRAYPNPHAPRVILVENGSAVSPNQFSDIQRIFLPENTGYGTGNNHGLRAALMAGAKFVVLLNNDVRVAPGAIEGMRQVVDQPRIGLVGVPMQEPEGLVWGGGTVSWWTLQTRFVRRIRHPAQLHYIHGACLGVTRQCIERIGWLREDLFLYWEDVDFGLRARRAGFSFAVANVSPLVHGSTADADTVRRTISSKTYYLVRNAVYVVRAWSTPLLRVWIWALLPARQVFARLRGKEIVARALADAAEEVRGVMPPQFS